MASDGEKTPVTVITGFLGAGKTTLINYILTQRHGRKICVIENEFGAVSVDNKLGIAEKLDSKEDLVMLDNGCACCTVRGDLMETFHKLAEQEKTFDAIIIELSGMADPAPVAFTITGTELQTAFRIDSIVCLVDAKHISQHLNASRDSHDVNEAVSQVAFADRILLNKVDLVDAAQKRAILEELHSINSFARVVECEQSAVPLDQIVNVSAFTTGQAEMLEQEFEYAEGEERRREDEAARKESLLRFWGSPWPAAAATAVAAAAVGAFVQDAAASTVQIAVAALAAGLGTQEYGKKVTASIVPACCASGVCEDEEACPKPQAKAKAGGGGKGEGGSKKSKRRGEEGDDAVAGGDSKKSKKGHRKGARTTESDDKGILRKSGKVHKFGGVTSVAIKLPGELHYLRFCGFMNSWLPERGADLYRSKGICAVGGRDAKYVFQGVHDQVEFKPSETQWQDGDDRSTTLVFIGRNLDKAELQAALDATVIEEGEEAPEWEDDEEEPMEDEEDSLANDPERLRVIIEGMDLKTLQNHATDLGLPLKAKGKAKRLAALREEVMAQLLTGAEEGDITLSASHGHDHDHSHDHIGHAHGH